jgi:hypothetical protein
MRTFEEINEIIGNLDDYTYELTKEAAELWYSRGDRDLLTIASKYSGLTPDEILAM